MKKLLVIFISLLLLKSATSLLSQNIFTAISKDNIEQVKSILEEDAGKLNVVLDNAYTPLSFASMLGKEAIVSYLISKSTSVNIIDKSIKSPIFYSVYRGHLNIVKLLVENGAHLDGTTMGMSLLHTAVINCHLQIAEYLLSIGMNINEKDSYGHTPLHMAVEFGYLDICELLITKGADLNIRSNNGTTPLHLSDEADQQKISQFLTSKGAKRVSRDFPVFKEKYLGSEYPGTSLELFTPNRSMRIIGPHSGVAISQDGKEIFWVRGDYSGKLWYMKEAKGACQPGRRFQFLHDG